MIGKLVITFDFELGWGALENGRWREREKAGVYEGLRQVLPQLVRELVRLNVPATWAVVGGMMDPEVADKLEHLPIELRRVTARALKDANRSTFYGSDLVSMVEGKTGQYFAHHSYSHVRFSFPGLDSRFVEAEMERSADIWAVRKWPASTTFVYPQNHEGYQSALFAAGIRKVRGSELAQNRTLLQKVMRNTVRVPQLSEVSFSGGVESHTGSLFFKVPPNSSVRLAMLKQQARRLLNRAVLKQGTAHVYLHPFNLAESEELFEAFLVFLRLADRLRAQKKLEIVPF